MLYREYINILKNIIFRHDTSDIEENNKNDNEKSSSKG